MSQMTAAALKATGTDLDFAHALIIHNKPPQPEDRPDDGLHPNLPPLPLDAPATTSRDTFDYSHFSFVEVKKYIPDPTRREFGVLKLN